MKPAVQLYTIREYTKTPEAIAESFLKLKDIGYRAVQVSGIEPIGDTELKRLADEAGMTICATHNRFTDLQNNLNAVIEKHRNWDSRYVGIGGIPIEYRTNAEGYMAFAREISDIGGRLKQAGLKFIYHNHNVEFVWFGGKSGMQLLFEHTDPEVVDFELDVYWLQAAGADPISWIHRLQDRMKVVHLKDMAVTAEREQRYAALGEGNMNMAAIVKACVETGVEWGVVEQDECYGRDPFECLSVSYRYLTRRGITY